MGRRTKDKEILLNDSIKFKMTKQEKRQYKQFCKDRGLVMSKHLRLLMNNCQRLIKEKS